MNKFHSFYEIEYFLKKLREFFPVQKFNHASVTQTNQYGNVSLGLAQLSESNFYLQGKGSASIPYIQAKGIVDTNKAYFSKLEYFTNSRKFSAKISVISENFPRETENEKELVTYGSNAAFEADFVSAPYSISLGAGFQYDKNILCAALLTNGKYQYYFDCLLSDKGPAYNISATTKLGLFGNLGFKTPFEINDLIIGFIKQYKIFNGMAACDIIRARLELHSLLTANEELSCALTSAYDYKQKRAELKLGAILTKNAKLRINVDMRGNLEMDVFLNPKPWLNATLSSHTVITKPDSVNFGWSLDFCV